MVTTGWRHQTYGTVADPIHKSHLNVFAGPYGCPRKFELDRQYTEDDTSSVSHTAALGTATHGLLAAYLTLGETPPPDVSAVTRALMTWLGELAAEVDPDDVRERAEMILGLYAHGLPRHVRRVVAVEAAFIAPFDEYWLSGHVDLVYEPLTGPRTLAIADWKTGAQKPHAIDLDHGWEAGVYSAALRHGTFVPHNGRTRAELEAILIARARAGGLTPTYGVMPSEIYHVHLADYVPYRKAGSKVVTRPEDLRAFGYSEPTKHAYKAGQIRGGAWIPVRLTEHDLPRCKARLRQVVGTIRMGRMYDRPGVHCTWCRHMTPCLNSGYAEHTAAERKYLLNLLREDSNT